MTIVQNKTQQRLFWVMFKLYLITYFLYKIYNVLKLIPKTFKFILQGS